MDRQLRKAAFISADTQSRHSGASRTGPSLFIFVRRKLMKLSFSFWLLISSLAALTISGSAQVSTGTPPFGSFGGGPFDTVNLGNLNVHFAIPVVAQGWGMPFTYDLNYDSSIWTAVTSSGVATCNQLGLERGH
jgi:hypothetical protein